MSQFLDFGPGASVILRGSEPVITERTVFESLAALIRRQLNHLAYLSKLADLEITTMHARTP